jgi:hypothetical protein
MGRTSPKERHERMLAHVDREKIVIHQHGGGEQEIDKIAVILARQCDLLVHFQRLWALRVGDLGGEFNSEDYTRNIFMNRRALYKELFKPVTR